MKIIIDMQGAQSSGSASRGIGRYTKALTSAIIDNRGQHQVILLLNGAFPETSEQLRCQFSELIGNHNILTWNNIRSASFSSEDNDFRRKAAELQRELFISSLNPDVLLISSFFEGFVDDAVTSIGLAPKNYLVATVLYDLIPLINHPIYLSNQRLKQWYLEKLSYFKQIDLFFGISESASKEAIDYLKIPNSSVVNISTDADSHFKELDVSLEQQNIVKNKYNISGKFIMYTGGIDYRKNLDGLIKAYSLLAPSIRHEHQLAIVCSADPSAVHQLENLALSHGIEDGQIVFTNYVPDEELLILYNLCELFVFPSWHEGFGLPALEAMRCGAPVIGSNCSSIPEIVNIEDALFDPHSIKSISQLIEKSLLNKHFKQLLIENSRIQAKKFDWNQSAKRVINKLELEGQHTSHHARPLSRCSKRLRLAYISPLPPQRSGIANYSIEFIKHLAIFYDIDLVNDQCVESDSSCCGLRLISVDKFRNTSASYERILYHFGNSTYHSHMFDLLFDIPGVVVMHDFYMSGILHYIQSNSEDSLIFDRALFDSHGYKALFAKATSDDIVDVIMKYPCNIHVLQNSIGIITHSRYSKTLAQNLYSLPSANWKVVPLAREKKPLTAKDEARKILGIDKDSFVVCSFGIIGPTKLNHLLLEAWEHSIPFSSSSGHLIYVGQNDPGDYGKKLYEDSARLGFNQVLITGWIDDNMYELYLAAADIAVQLRTASRGETSAAILDCMSSGIPVIANAHGSISEINQDCLLMLRDSLSAHELAQAINLLYNSIEKRETISSNAFRLISDEHLPIKCAALYRNAIEDFYKNPSITDQFLAAKVSSALPHQCLPSEPDLIDISNHYAISIPKSVRPRQLMIDVTSVVNIHSCDLSASALLPVVKNLVLSDDHGFDVQPIHRIATESFNYSRKFTMKLLGMNCADLHDTPVSFCREDVLYVDTYLGSSPPLNARCYRQFIDAGVEIIACEELLRERLCFRSPATH